jgi:hypothetical protein
MPLINLGQVFPVDVGSGSAVGGNSVEAEDMNAGANADADKHRAARAAALPVRNSSMMLRLSFGNQILPHCPPCGPVYNTVMSR